MTPALLTGQREPRGHTSVWSEGPGDGGPWNSYRTSADANVCTCHLTQALWEGESNKNLCIYFLMLGIEGECAPTLRQVPSFRQTNQQTAHLIGGTQASGGQPPFHDHKTTKGGNLQPEFLDLISKCVLFVWTWCLLRYSHPLGISKVKWSEGNLIIIFAFWGHFHLNKAVCFSLDVCSEVLGHD